MKFLNSEYPKYNPENKLWKSGFFRAMVVLIVLVLFQPFGFRDKDLELKMILFPVYSLVAYLHVITDFSIVRKILKSKKIWYIKNELLSLMTSALLVTFLVLLLNVWITGDMPLNFHWYFKLLYHVSSLILIIAVIEFLYYNSKSSDIKIEQLSSQIQLVLQQSGSLNQGSFSETIPFTLENDSLDINRKKIILIKSTGNYLEFYLNDGNGHIKKLLKRGRIHQAEKDLAPFPEFFRCHRAFVINLKHAKQIRGNSKNARLIVDQKIEEIPVSRSLFTTLKDKLDKIIAG